MLLNDEMIKQIFFGDFKHWQAMLGQMLRKYANAGTLEERVAIAEDFIKDVEIPSRKKMQEKLLVLVFEKLRELDEKASEMSRMISGRENYNQK
ncbi:MAG: hypothetical protein ACTSRA_11575 [Promethearchaeota archaeon]